MRKILIFTLLIVFFVFLAPKAEAGSACNSYSYSNLNCYPVIHRGYIPPTCRNVVHSYYVPHTCNRAYCVFYANNCGRDGCCWWRTMSWSCGGHYVYYTTTRCSGGGWYSYTTTTCNTSYYSSNFCLNSSSDTVTAGDSITFSWTSGSNSYQYTHKVNNGSWSSWTNLGSITSISSPMTSEGVNYIKVRGYLNGAWRESGIVTINVSPAVYRPTSSWITTSKTETYTNENITLEWGGTKEPTYYKYNVDNTGWYNIYQTSLVFKPHNYNWTEDSQHSIQIKACNSKGCNNSNIGAVSIYIKKYVVQPTTSYINPSYQEVGPNEPFSLSWGGDNKPAYYQYRLDQKGSFVTFANANTTTYNSFLSGDYGWERGSTHIVELRACNDKGCAPADSATIKVINTWLPGFLR